MNEAHIIQIPEAGVFLAHGHDLGSHLFIENLLTALRHDECTHVFEGQAGFPLEYLPRFRRIAEEAGVGVVEGEE